MPKLIIKHDNKDRRRQNQSAKWLSIAGLLGMVGVVVATGYVFYQSTDATAKRIAPLVLNSASDPVQQASYDSLQAVLADLDAEYEALSASGVDDYQKNLKLLGKAEGVLRHLERMEQVGQRLVLDEKERLELANRHQFYQDYWQSKQHFRALRVSRFEQQSTTKVVSDTTPSSASGTAQVELVSSQSAQTLADDKAEEPALSEADLSAAGLTEAPRVPPDQPAPRKFQFAKPPPDMALPAGFCDLSNPGACKPEGDAGESVEFVAGATPDAADAEPVAVELVEQLPLEDTLPDNLDVGAEPADAPSADSGSGDGPLTPPPGKKTFQFAKPPPGMKLPAGFCDLQNPGSCQPADDDAPPALSNELDRMEPDTDEVMIQPPQNEPVSLRGVTDELPSGVLGKVGEAVSFEAVKPESVEPDMAEVEPDAQQVEPVSVPSVPGVSKQKEQAKRSMAVADKVKRSATDQSAPRPGDTIRLRVRKPTASIKRPAEQVASNPVARPPVVERVSPAARQKPGAIEHDLRVLEQSLGIPLQ